MYEPFEVRNFFNEMNNDGVGSTLYERLHKSWNCWVILGLQQWAPTTKKSINVFMSVPNYEEVDINLAENAFEHQHRVESKNPSIFVVT